MVQTSKKILILISFFIIKGMVYSQSINIPPSPDAANLVSNFTKEFNYFTGSPNISFPLVSISTKGISIPITLSYDATGRKVNELASNVGLGWSLHTGGIITRVVCGFPDDYDKNDEGSDNRGIFYEDVAEKVNNFDVFETEFIKKSKLKEFEDGHYDTEPDVFFIDIPGYSGKFVFDKDKKIHSVPASNLNIEPIFAENELASFEVIDEYGNRFSFEDAERTVAKVVNAKNFYGFAYDYDTLKQTFNSTWKLTSIKDIFGSSIDFTYGDINFSTDINYVQSLKSVSHVQIFSDITVKQLESIETDTKKILFKSNNNRTDIPGTNSLDSIVIYWKNTSLNSEMVRGYQFNYGYFVSDDPDNPDIEPTEEEYFRLKLLSFREFVDDDKLPAYQFTYNESDKLPARNTYSYDLWGYFNNYVSRNGTPILYYYPNEPIDQYRAIPIPNYTDDYYILDSNMFFTKDCYTQFDPDRPSSLIYTCTGSYWQIWISDGSGWYDSPSFSDLRPDIRIVNNNIETVMDAYTLSEIKFPQGGEVYYNYEPHEYVYEGQTYRGGGLRVVSIEDYDNGQLKNKIKFEYTEEQDGQEISSGKLFWKPVYGCPSFNKEAIECSSISSYYFTELYYEASTERFSTDQSIFGANSGPNIGYSKVKTISQNGSWKEYSYYCPVTYEESTNLGVKDYFPTYIEEIIYDGWDDGDKNYTVTKCGITLPAYNGFPFPPNSNFDWNRGQLLSQKSYDSNGKLVHEIKNRYKTFYKDGLSPSIVYGIVNRKFNYPLNGGDIEEWEPQRVYGKYKIVTDVKSVLLSMEENNYVDIYSDTTMKISKVTDYEYNDFGYISSVSTTDSKNDSIKTEYKYTPDYPNLFYYGKLSNPVNNYLRYNIETITSKSNKTIGAIINYYDCKNCLFGLHGKLISGKFLPKNTRNLNLSYPITDYSTFHETYGFDDRASIITNYDLFDSRGNLLQFHDEFGNDISVIMGYNNSVTIAKVENAKCPEIFFDSFEEEREGISENNRKKNIGHAGECSFRLDDKWGLLNLCETNIPKNVLSDKYTFSVWYRTIDLTDGTNVANFGYYIYDQNGTELKALSYFLKETGEMWKNKTFEVDLADIKNANPSATSFVIKPVIFRRDNYAVYVDDFRMHPSDAMMTTYTHKPLIGPTSVTGPNNKPITYEYDNFGRLYRTYDHKGNLMKQHEYHYQGQE